MTTYLHGWEPSRAARSIDCLIVASTEQVARRAARLWFESERGMSAAMFRDWQFHKYCHRKRIFRSDRHEFRHVFRRAYEQEIGRILIEEGRLCAADS